MTSSNDLNQGLGIHSLWGLSPSFNLLSRLPSTHSENASSELNILLSKPSDVRHIIHTMGRRKLSDCSGKINIFLLESESEVLARHLLQLYLFLDTNIPIRHRASLYLELYNSLLSKRGQDYVVHSGKELGDVMHSDGDSSSYLEKVIDLTWLKQKERDSLHQIFSCSWVKSGDENSSLTGQDYSVKTLREYRMRGYYGDRYDW